MKMRRQNVDSLPECEERIQQPNWNEDFALTVQ